VPQNPPRAHIPLTPLSLSRHCRRLDSCSPGAPVDLAVHRRGTIPSSPPLPPQCFFTSSWRVPRRDASPSRPLSARRPRGPGVHAARPTRPARGSQLIVAARGGPLTAVWRGVWPVPQLCARAALCPRLGAASPLPSRPPRPGAAGLRPGHGTLARCGPTAYAARSAPARCPALPPALARSGSPAWLGAAGARPARGHGAAHPPAQSWRAAPAWPGPLPGARRGPTLLAATRRPRRGTRCPDVVRRLPGVASFCARCLGATHRALGTAACATLRSVPRHDVPVYPLNEPVYPLAYFVYHCLTLVTHFT
jgi:hypothetical protein